MSRFFPLPIGILCVQREKPLAVKQARHVGSLSSACQHPISHTFLAILFFLQIFCAFTKKEKVSLFKKKLLLRTARERESDLRAWWCQYRSRGGFQVEIGPSPTIFFAQRLFVGLSVVFFFVSSSSFAFCPLVFSCCWLPSSSISVPSKAQESSAHPSWRIVLFSAPSAEETRAHKNETNAAGP